VYVWRDERRRWRLLNFGEQRALFYAAATPRVAIATPPAS
jgi:hypothetical protein